MGQISLPLDIESLEVVSQRIDKQGNIVFTVVSKSTQSTCHQCGKPATKSNGRAPTRQIRHLPIFDQPVYLEITPERYYCEDCDTTTTEQYDWAARNATTTKGLDDYILRCVVNSTLQDVKEKESLSYRTIQTILNRRVSKDVDWSCHDDLNILGIDEIALRKGHNDYVSIISSKSGSGKLTVLAVLQDRKKADVKAFFESIPSALMKTVKQVCSDMHDGYVYAAIEVFGPHAVIIDRYHVAKLYREPLDKLRMSEMKRIKTSVAAEEYARLEGMMWILRKKHECLSQADKDKLSLLYKHSPLLKKAHKLALKLTQIFNTHSNRSLAMAKINRWITRVEKSELTCFNTFIKTLTKYKPYIANYFKARKNSGFVEGLNNKIKVLKRRCYGLLSTETIFQRLFLDLNGRAAYA